MLWSGNFDHENAYRNSPEILHRKRLPEQFLEFISVFKEANRNFLYILFFSVKKGGYKI